MRPVPVAALTLAWFLTLVMGLEWAFREGYPFKWRDLEPYYLLRSNDDWGHVGFKLQRIRADHEPHHQRYVFLGGSAALEAITTDAEMTEHLRERLGTEDVWFHSLVSSYKTFADEAKLVDALAGIPGVTLLVHVEPWRFKTAPKDQVEYSDTTGRFVPKYYYLPLPEELNPVLGEAKDPVPWVRQVSLVANHMPRVGEILKKRARLYFEYDRWYTYRYRRHQASNGKKPWSKERYTAFASRIPNNKQYQKFSDYNFEILQTAIVMAQEAGHRVILVEAAVNAESERALAEFGKGYPDDIAALMDATGVKYMDFAMQEQWPNELFRDHHHMLDAGRERFTRTFADALVRFEASRLVSR